MGAIHSENSLIVLDSDWNLAECYSYDLNVPTWERPAARQATAGQFRASVAKLSAKHVDERWEYP